AKTKTRAKATTKAKAKTQRSATVATVVRTPKALTTITVTITNVAAITNTNTNTNTNATTKTTTIITAAKIEKDSQHVKSPSTKTVVTHNQANSTASDCLLLTSSLNASSLNEVLENMSDVGSSSPVASKKSPLSDLVRQDLIVMNAMSLSSSDPSPRPSYIRPSWDASNNTSNSVASEILSDSALDQQTLVERDIHKEVWGLYDLFIHPNGNKQFYYYLFIFIYARIKKKKKKVNVGYDVARNVRYNVHHMDSLPSKVHIFDQAVEQILRLIRSSILTNFYSSMEFYAVSKRREKKRILFKSHLSTGRLPRVGSCHSNHKLSSTSAISSLTDLLFQSSEEDHDAYHDHDYDHGYDNDNDHNHDHDNDNDEDHNYSFQYACQYQTSK
ncbi:cation diffusion facilitator family transporter containing protein, partial [Reticulomyxa filosa]